MLNKIRLIKPNEEEIDILRTQICGIGHKICKKCDQYFSTDDKTNILNLQSHWKFANKINDEQSKDFPGEDFFFY